jgi:hypothetical protein
MKLTKTHFYTNLVSASTAHFKKIYLEIISRKLSDRSEATTITEVFKVFKDFRLFKDDFKTVDQAVQKIGIKQKRAHFLEGLYEWLVLAQNSLVKHVTATPKKTISRRLA